jgi:hypothetical protein
MTTSFVATPQRAELRLWLALLVLGLLGFGLATPYFLTLFEQLARTAGRPLPPLPVLLLSEAVKVGVLCGVAGFLGVRAARRTGLAAPLLEARLAGAPIGLKLLQLVPLALLVGTVGSLVVVGLNLALAGSLPDAMRLGAQQVAPGDRLGAFLVGASSAFYGGVVEELLLRWGLLSLLMWAGLRLGLARLPAFWVANVLSALLFGAGHLPVVLAAGFGGAPVIGYVVVANAAVGLACGVLFFRRGLEQAILAHAWADVALHALPLLLLG